MTGRGWCSRSHLSGVLWKLGPWRRHRHSRCAPPHKSQAGWTLEVTVVPALLLNSYLLPGIPIRHTGQESVDKRTWKHSPQCQLSHPHQRKQKRNLWETGATLTVPRMSTVGMESGADARHRDTQQRRGRDRWGHSDRKGYRRRKQTDTGAPSLISDDRESGEAGWLLLNLQHPCS